MLSPSITAAYTPGLVVNFPVRAANCTPLFIDDPMPFAPSHCSVWIGRKNSVGKMDFVPTPFSKVASDRRKFHVYGNPRSKTPFRPLQAGEHIVIGVTDSTGVKRTVAKVGAVIKEINQSMLTIHVHTVVEDGITAPGSAAPELVDPDADADAAYIATAFVPVAAAAPATPSLNAKVVFDSASNRETLPVEVKQDIANESDFSSFLSKLKRHGYTLQFVPNDRKAAVLAQLTRTEIFALLSQIDDNTLASELDSRGYEVTEDPTRRNKA
jgi:hypothetical protein